MWILPYLLIVNDNGNIVCGISVLGMALHFVIMSHS